ncbi:MAG: pilus assembly protein TadG-related protein, partial [Telluria sp.]
AKDHAVKPVPLHSRQRQRGAVAILVGLTLLVLLAAGGLVLDLGHLYILKSELQNAADSAALAGAKEINLSAPGISAATTKAIAFAAQNKVDFSQPVVLTDANISFGTTPDGPWFSVGEASANPAGKSFIKVDTGTRTAPAYLMMIAGIATVSTHGVAVAGRFVVDITPLGVCAVDPLNRLGARLLSTPPELLEYGFRRGTTYDFLSLKNVAGASDPMLIDPVDSPPAACVPANNSINFTAPFLCQGNSAVAGGSATHVYANTGVSAGKVESSLNSRFNDFGGSSSCMPASAPPDRNVREYIVNNSANGPGKYMALPAQSQQSQPIVGGLVVPAFTPATQGVLWTYARPLQANGTAGNYSAGSAFDTADWASLYHGQTTIAGQYPAAANDAPYAQTSGPYFLAPGSNPPASNRRLMNVAILDCTIPAGSGSCNLIPLLGVGRFFLQRRVALTGSDKGMWVEFAGLIAPVPNSEIKLYR